MKNKTEKQSQAEVRPVLTITSLDQLQALVNETAMCQFELDGTRISVPVNRISPGVAERERAITRTSQPPYKADRKDYDPLDPAYLAARDLAALKARAFIVYACCPAVSAKKPGLTGVDDIFNFVQGLLTENILNLIALSARVGGMNLEREVAGANFTLAPGSGLD